MCPEVPPPCPPTQVTALDRLHSGVPLHNTRTNRGVGSLDPGRTRPLRGPTRPRVRPQTPNISNRLDPPPPGTGRTSLETRYPPPPSARRDRTMAGFAPSGSSGLGHPPVCASLTHRPSRAAWDSDTTSLPACKTRIRPVKERCRFCQEIIAVGEGRA